MDNISKIQNKYSDFFNLLTINKKIKYIINEDSSIDIFYDDDFKELNYLLPTINLYSEIKHIPSRTTFHGSIYINEHTLKTIGKEIIVKGFIDINSNDLESIGEGLWAESIRIRRCNKLKIFPNNIKTKKIILQYCNIQEFGKNIKTESLEIIDKDHKNHSIKNTKNLEAKKLIIHKDVRFKNISEIKNLKTIECNMEISEEAQKELIDSFKSLERIKNKVDNFKIVLDNKINENFLKTIKKLGYTNLYQNYLDFKSPNSFCRKLINEDYNLITKKDMLECVLLNNKEVLICKNKIPIRMIDYCVGPRGIIYLKKIGYEFTKEESKTIIDSQIKSYYEKELIYQSFKIKKMTKLNKRSI